MLYRFITGKLLNAHHVVHRSRGGPTDDDNLVTLCPNHHAIAHALTGGGKTTATSLLPTPVTGKTLLNAMRDIDTDPDGWTAKRNHKFASKMIGKSKSLLENLPARAADTSPEGYLSLFCKLESLRHMKRPVNPENLPNILKTRDLAILFDIGPNDVVEMARRGILKGYKSGIQWRFRREDVEQYISGLPETE
jgi:excisionase family DNA binding protein